MKTYKATILNFNGEQLEFSATEEEIKGYKNISNLIFEKHDKTEIKKIEVELWNEYTKDYYKSLTYDYCLEQLKNGNNRVEITYDYDGIKEKVRCYIGKSTGWIPCYLEIKRSDSTGGGSLVTNRIKDIKIIK